MTDWDDVRFFLAVARGGSVRAGAEHLGVRHSTVLRRLTRLEERLHARLFDRLPAGYRLTEAGREALDLAEQMALTSHTLDTVLLGRDQAAAGLLRVTMTPMLASHLLMPDLAHFARLYPEVEIQVLSSDEPANLTNREADLAVRVVYDAGSLPLNLHALKGPDLFGAIYLSRDLLAAWSAGRSSPLPWVLKEFDGVPDWAHGGGVPIGPARFTVVEAGAHIAAVRLGLGVTTLPCFVGDVDPLLVRAPGSAVHRHGSLYLLTQGQTRRTRRVRLFQDFINDRLAAHGELLAGLRSHAG